MFYKVMQNEELCKKMLEVILGNKIGKITRLSRQKIINNTYGAKGVRFDVLAKDTRETLYNIEMQMTCEEDLIHRLRYYQSSLDMASLDVGQAYNELPKTIIIFLCNGDMLGNGLPISTIRKRCDEDGCIIEDGTTHIVINYLLDYLIKDEGLRGLCRYCKTKEVTDELTKEVDDMVESVKLNAKARKEYHFLSNRYPDFILKAMKEGEQKGIEKGRTEGRAEGRAEERLARTLTLARSFRDIGVSLDKIAEATGLSEEEIRAL